MSKVLFEKKKNLAIVTLNRPEQLNCIDYETLLQLETIITTISLDKEVYTVIFTGAGEKSFSAGADIKERQHLSEEQVRRNVYKIRDVITMIDDLPQPTIAAINGYALGGGFELALACDFRYAVSEAIMGLIEVSLAIIPGGGGTQRLPRLIGMAKAKELIFTARKVNSAEAKSYGILNEVVPRQELMKKAEQLAEEIMNNGPIAVKQAKYAMNIGCQLDLKTGLALETKAYETVIQTDDRLEALAAFKEKRKPAFIGK